MKNFLVPYRYSRCGVLEVQAESLEQAKELAEELSVDNAQHEFFVADSFVVDDEFAHEITE